jgi:hypothetical protein
MERVYIWNMVYRSFIAAILLAAMCGGAAYAADAVAPGATLIDITGQVSTAGLAGGVADPVPIFVGASGPVVFVMNLNPAEDAMSRAHETRIRANPELNRR